MPGCKAALMTSGTEKMHSFLRILKSILYISPKFWRTNVLQHVKDLCLDSEHVVVKLFFLNLMETMAANILKPVIDLAFIFWASIIWTFCQL